jgi:hypothetical protein
MFTLDYCQGKIFFDFLFYLILGSYETLVKTVYLEKQNDKNIILRSWSSLVGFKRNSNEIVDFLVSILGYSDEGLKLRIIESFKYLPMSRLSEFMKLFERFRLAVSEDFVNLKRSRRNEKAKLEITRVYKNVLISWKSKEITNLTPLRMILRHLIELYYYVSKNEIVDEFIWILRGEFCSLLKEYLAVIKLFNSNVRKSFLPLKFHLEVWLTVDEWQQQNHPEFVDGFREDIEELFVNFSFNLISAVSEVDKGSLPSFIDNLIIKISRITTKEEFKTSYVYNVLKSSDKTFGGRMVFVKLVEWIGSGRDSGKSFQEGIKAVLKDSPDTIEGPEIELFNLMCDDDRTADPESALEVFNLVSDAKMQRKILKKMEFELKDCKLSDKMMKNLFVLNEKLMEIFPNTLRGLWRSIIKEEKDRMSQIIHFLMEKVQRDHGSKDKDDFIEVIVFIYKSIEEIDRNLVLGMLLRYAHPFMGTKKVYNLNPLESVIKVLERAVVVDDNDIKHEHEHEHDAKIRTLQVLFLNNSQITPAPDPFELMNWALECPVREISSSAWRELKKQAANFLFKETEFIKVLLKGTRRFLQHLVCPATLKYFDPNLVKEILEFYIILVNNNCDFEIVELIYELALVQLGGGDDDDDDIFIYSCELIKKCLKKSENLITVSLYKELKRKPSISIDLLFELMELDTKVSIEKYFCHLFAFLPFIFRLFEESLNLQQLTKTFNFDYSAEFEYLSLLIKMNQRVIIEEAQVDENGNLCLLELGEFLISIEKQKKRSEIDFYKTIATILATLNKFTLNLFSEADEEKFLIYYFDYFRVEKVKIPHELAFKVANRLADSNQNCPLRQGVIDFLIFNLIK